MRWDSVFISLRMVLMRPVSRLQVLIAKLFSLSLYSALMLAVLGFSSYGVSLMLLGQGDIAIIATQPYGIPAEYGKMFLYEPSEAINKIWLSYLFALPQLVSVCALSLMFAAWTRHFTSSAILTTTLYFSTYIVGIIPFLSSVHAYLPSRYWSGWKFTLVDSIPWDVLMGHMAWTAAYIVVFLFISSAIFRNKDL